MKLFHAAVAVLLSGLSCWAGGFRDQAPDSACTPAVWTGREMIVWSGAGTQTGGRLDVAAGRWAPTSIGPETPAGRAEHTAVWTGGEMIVWGGWKAIGGGSQITLDDGAIYEPNSDTWRPMGSALGVVESRARHTAVWTGQVMIVWGGTSYGVFRVDSGGIYDPASDTWRATTRVGAPTARSDHTAVWTGSEMIVWGGTSGGAKLADGGRYDPATDSWRPVSTAGAPSGRTYHTAVWTGTEMIVWGGLGATGDVDTGGRYDPVTDTWQATSTGTNLPLYRDQHSAVWTGSEMIVWGGRNAPGGRYDPVTDSWASIPLDPAVLATRKRHATVWTGSEMVVWGGLQANGLLLDTGGIFDPASGAWRATPHEAPAGRSRPPCVWTGTELLVWGGRNGATWLGEGGRYDPARDTWRPMSTGPLAPAARDAHTFVWTGAEAIVWGGRGPSMSFGDGARYDPAADAWSAVSPIGAPSARSIHSALWTGTEMIVWGGALDQSGGRYDPASDTWSPTSTAGAVPTARYGQAAIWTGTEMILWSGAEIPSGIPVSTGARYDPVADTWSPMSAAGAPAGSIDIVGAWTGSSMYVLTSALAAYDPTTDVWSSPAQPPAAFYGSQPVWDGSQLLLWGGDLSSYRAEGYGFDPVTGLWTALATDGQPSPRAGHACIWTGRDLIVWGGSGSGWIGANMFATSALSSGGIYDPARDRWRASRPRATDLLAGMGPGPSYGASVAGIRADGSASSLAIDAFPGVASMGTNVAAGDVRAGGSAEVVVAAGPDPASPPRVRGFDAGGLPVAGLDFVPYGAAGYGARVATAQAGDVTAMLTGPGPASVYGPHVRGFAFGAGGTVAQLPGLSFFAYGTLRYGVHVAATDTSGNGRDELLTGAGAGAVFGPHVRAFAYGGSSVNAVAKVNFFAYQTLRYGVEVGAGDIDGDGYGEILTGPGPSAVFPAVLRGFDVDGGQTTAIARINATVMGGARFGANPAGGDVDGDGYDEIVVGAGPDPAFASALVGLDYDGAALAPIPALALDPFGASYGTRVATGSLDL